MSWTNYHYHSRYGYPRWIAYIAEFWWRIEHLSGPRLGYPRRKPQTREQAEAHSSIVFESLRDYAHHCGEALSQPVLVHLDELHGSP